MPVTEREHALLERAWTALDGDQAELDAVQVGGDGSGLLPSALAALPAMVAAVTASTLAASLLDRTRQGSGRATVRIDREHVAVAARSERHARVGSAPAPDPFAPLSRFWRTADGWLRLHANYDWHRQRALQVLGTEDGRPTSVEEAVRRWPGAQLEEALAAAGALGYMVRTREQWREHPQGQALVSLPLLQGRRATGRPRRLGPGRAAAGVRVLDLTRVIAGPVATRTLAAWGAEVLRLDSPSLPEIPTQAVDTLPGKRSAELDLSVPPGRATLDELLAAADVLVQGYRPGALDRYGLDPQELTERHPHLSVVVVSAWGPAGPWAHRRGFDSLVQCPTGIADAEGHDGEPGALPAQVLDHATGYLAAAAALLSLADVADGRPPRVTNLSLAQTAHWLLDAGTTTPEPPRSPAADRYLVTLAGASSPVTVVSPPGEAGDLRPHWNTTTELGADPPSFA